MPTTVGTPPGVTASGVNTTPWTPAKLNLAAWWDASDAATVINPSNITQWNDKSGNARNLIADPGTCKMFTVKGKPMVGTTPMSTTATQMRVTGWTRQAVETIIGVYWTNTLDPTYPASGQFDFHGQISAGDRSLYWAGNFYSGYNTFFGQPGVLSDNLRVLAMCSDGASSWMDVDRVRTTGNNNTSPPVGFQTTKDTWSGYSTGGPGVATGELFIINGAIAAAELVNAYNYLTAKWGTP